MILRKLAFVLVLSGLVAGCSSSDKPPEHVVSLKSATFTGTTDDVVSSATVAVAAIPNRRDLGMVELADAARIFADKVAAYAFPEDATK